MADRIDQRTDVYSLGVILYQMLTGGQFPYEVVGTMRDVLNNILTTQPLRPSRVLAAADARAGGHTGRLRLRPRLRPHARVSPVMEAIVLKTLGKSRSQRYQSAGEMARDVSDYLAGRPTRAGYERRAARRPRAVPPAAVAAIIIGIVAGAIAWHRAGHGWGLPRFTPVSAN